MTPTTTHTVLVVDDEKHNRTLLADLLREDCRVLLAKNGEQALQRAREQQPDLILLDVLMPDMDGYQVIQALKNDDATRRIPVIFVSALDAPENEERGLDLGAADYISKPFHPSIVRKRVRNHLQAVHQRHLLEKMAMIDAVTELPNRHRYNEVLLNEWRRCNRMGIPLSLSIIDIDHFKRYNDHHGHAHGDVVLKQIAQKIGEFVRRPGDLAARYGGEEFVIVLPGADAASAQQHTEDICRAIEAMQIPHPASVSPYVTVSVGGATQMPDQDGNFIPILFKAADTALYRAKAEGKNRVVWDKN